MNKVTEKEIIRRNKLSAFYREKKVRKCKKCGAEISDDEKGKLIELKKPFSKYKKCLKCLNL